MFQIFKGSFKYTLGTVKVLNVWTPQKFAVMTLKFEQDGFTKE